MRGNNEGRIILVAGDSQVRYVWIKPSAPEMQEVELGMFPSGKGGKHSGQEEQYIVRQHGMKHIFAAQ